MLGRAPEDDVLALLRGHGYAPRIVAGDDPRQVHRDFAAALDAAHAEIRAIQHAARAGTGARRGHAALAGDRAAHAEGLDRAARGRRHRASRARFAPTRSRSRACARTPSTSRSSSAGCAATGPKQRFDAAGALVPELAALAPDGDLRMGALPQANGGRVLTRARPARSGRPTRSPSRRPATARAESTRALGELLRDVYARNPAARDFRLFCPDETNSNRLGSVFEVEDRMLRDARPGDEHVSPHGRVMEVLSEHNCEGWLEGYLLTGRHGLFATYEAFAMVSASMAIQHAKWLQHARRPARGARRSRR